MHSNNSVVTVLDEKDRTVYARRLPNNLDAIVSALRACAGSVRGVAAAAGATNPDAITLMLAQVLRKRLPRKGALARLAPTHFCALVPAPSALGLENELARLTFPKATVSLPDSRISVELPLSVSVSWLADMDPLAGPEALWAQALRAQA